MAEEKDILAAVGENLGMPYDDEAERAVLGSILLDQSIILTIAAILRPSDFYKDSNKKIYETLLQLNESNKSIDTLLLTKALRDLGCLEAIGGRQYITDLYNAVPSAAHAVEYARLVQDKAMRRSVISFAGQLNEAARSHERPAAEIIEAAESEIYELGQEANHSSLEHIAPIVANAYDNLGKQEETIKTFTELDKYLGGLHKSDVIIVAARPGMGKTTFCINLAVNSAIEHKKSVAFFSLEMSSEQLATRMLVSRAKVNTEHVKKWEKITDAEMKKLSEAMSSIAAANLYIDDTPNITVAEIRGKVRRLQKEKGLDLIVIDYIGLMQASSFLARSDNRQQQISEISRQIKGMAKELNVPIIVISQLNRTAVKGDNTSSTKEPDLSHLRESGALEQDADIVLFIHRPSYYNPETEDKNLARVIIAKHRNGAVGRVDMTFISEYTLFTDREKHHPEEGEPVPPEELAGYVESQPPSAEEQPNTDKESQPGKKAAAEAANKEETTAEIVPLDELPF